MPKPPDTSHVPTKALRRKVTGYARVGTKQEDIAAVLGIDPKTLRKHYREELDFAARNAIEQIGGALFTKAMGGDTGAMIFWLKTQAGWKETSKVEGDLKLTVQTGVPDRDQTK
jgi:hypothetical protein